MRTRTGKKPTGGNMRIDVGTVRTPWATFAVAATPLGIAAIFPVTGELTAARASRDPALRRRVRAGKRRVREGAELIVHPAARSYPASLARAVSALRAYASGRSARRLALDLDGTPFQMKVWNRLCAIPSGKTVSYGALAAAIGRPRAARAVGAAVGANPVPLLVPCHRVIGENGSLTGFGLGLPMKRALLAHEGYTTK